MKRPLVLFCLLWILGILLHGAFGLLTPEELPAAMTEEGARCTLEGTLVSVSQNAGGGCTLLMEDAENIPFGRVLVYCTAEQAQPLTLGCGLSCSGALGLFQPADNPGGFDARAYYRAEDLVCFLEAESVVQTNRRCRRLPEAARRLRERLREGLYLAFEDEEAGILTAMLLGDKSGLSEELRESYAGAGLSHLLTVSGLHISLIGAGLRLGAGWLLSFFPWERRKGPGRRGFAFFRAAAAAAGAGFYMLLAGFGVSVRRAGCMFLLLQLAAVPGVAYDLPSALAAAALMILIPRPAALFSSSFQLSFGCVLILGVLVPYYLKCRGLATGAGKAALSALLLQAYLLPLQLRYFYVFYAGGLAANLLVLPLVPWILGGGLLSAILARLLPAAAAVTAAPVGLLLKGLRFLCGKLSCACLTLGCPALRQMLLYWGLLTAALFLLGRKGKRAELLDALWAAGRSPAAIFLRELRYYFLPAAALAAVFCGAVFLPCQRQSDRLEIVSLYVGQGDCHVLLLPDGSTYLADCGSMNGSAGGDAALAFLRYSGVRRLNGILISHADSDHTNGILPLLKTPGLRVGCLLLPEAAAGDPALGTLLAEAEKQQIPVLCPAAGDVWELGEVRFEVLHPPEAAGVLSDNEISLVFRLSFGEFDGLFTGDLGGEAEKQLLRSGLLSETEWLKVGHHGSGSSSGEAFLAALRPLAASISCGKNNVYGHPHPAALARLEDAGAKVLRTDVCGAVTVTAFRDGSIIFRGFREP